jgi:hypothetical protein
MTGNGADRIAPRWNFLHEFGKLWIANARRETPFHIQHASEMVSLGGQLRQREGLMIRCLVLAAILISVPAVAMAQSDRERGDKACRGDVQRHCKSVIEQGDMAVLACLQTNRNRLSGTCTRFLQSVGQL